MIATKARFGSIIQVGFLVLAFVLQSASALAETTSPLAETQTTSDSSVFISGNLPEGAHWMTVAIQKEGEERVVDTVQVQSGAQIPTLYLQQGVGNYEVSLYVSNNEDRNLIAGYHQLASLKVHNDDERDVSFLLGSANIQVSDPAIIKLARKLTRGLRTDREKARAIHDWITREITYDVNGVKTGQFIQKRQDASFVLSAKLAVCEGYSNLFAALTRAVGIRTKIIYGPLGRLDPKLSKEQACRKLEYYHAWNETYVDHQWIIVDSTLDAGSEDGFTGKFKRSPNNHELFDANPSLFERNHLKCSEQVR
ncbi:MAG: transglutaminase domain-containing protein [Bdellovibrionia bacterium]